MDIADHGDAGGFPNTRPFLSSGGPGNLPLDGRGIILRFCILIII